MASPPEININNLSGKYVMDKKLSDDPDALLALQGISWFTRKTISLATVVLTIKEYTDKDGVTHIDIASNASNISTSYENRTLDFESRPFKDKIFGNVEGRSRLIDLSQGFEPVGTYSEDELQFLQAKVLKDGKTPSSFEGNEVCHSYVKNTDRGYQWTAEQIWGFEIIDGQRYYTRRAMVKNASGNKTERVRLVYAYQGKLDKEDLADGLAYGDE